MDLPTYESSSESTLLLGSDAHGSPPHALLNLVPCPGEVSFQRGYLGYSKSTVQGSLQIKFVESDPASYRSLVDKVTVEFAGVESIRGVADVDDAGRDTHAELSSHRGKRQQYDSRQPVDLIRECKTLWDRGTDSGADFGSSSFGATASSSSTGPPGNLDFAFQLTDDLPHCCHLGSGSIEYTLTARLHTSSGPDTSVTVLLHLARVSPPSSSATASSQPEIYTAHHPTDISIFFPHGTSNFLRSEAIELRVRVPPPDALLVEEKGLKLRSISAELVRIVQIHEGDDEQPEIVELLARPSLRTTISKSGKSAAFSSSRSIFLHIWLQPGNQDSCESITQTTIYNEVSFRIRVIASFRGKQGDREDVVFFDRPVTIIPDYPATAGLQVQAEEPEPSNVTALSGGYKPQYSATVAGTSQSVDADLLAIFENETEFDGYEQFSEGVNSETAPPNIDADEPPPTIDEATSSDGHETLPTSTIPQPVQGVIVPPSPTGMPELADEAPPYSSTTGASPSNVSPNVPTREAGRQDDVPLPPPPYEGRGV